jgi:hypothetical protein
MNEYVDVESETRSAVLKKERRQDKMEEIKGKYKIYIIKEFVVLSVQF